jgi:NAD(P)-dependent dehydrogenase (short-subunit alcohol dehydrogenase family)
VELGLGQQVVLITGGASHIGRAIVMAFAHERARIALADIDVEQAQRTADAARAAGAAEAAVFPVDVSDDARVRSVVTQVAAKMGAPRVLVNNAGWVRLMIPFREQAVDHWKKIIGINLVGTISCTQAVLPLMVAEGRGAIVSISSEASAGVAREPVYGATKAGINTLMRSVAKEYGPKGIRANAVSPSVVPPQEGEALGGKSLWASGPAQFTEEQLEHAKRSTPLRRLATPTDVANAVLFLASDVAASFVSGQVLSISGGA